MIRPRATWLVPLAFVLMPLRQLWLAWGWDRVAGLPGEAVFSSLFSGVQVRRWFTEGTWGQADLVAGSPEWWPEHLLLALWQAGVGALTDEGWAYGALLLVLATLSGLGPWLWLRRTTGDTRALGPALFIALLLQWSPAVLRVGIVGDLGVFGLGLLALALASRHVLGAGTWALLAGLWSPGTALTTLLAAVVTRRPALALAALPLAIGLAQSPSLVPGAVKVAEPPGATGPAYVAENGAVLPLPPGEVDQRAQEQTAAADTPAASTPTGATPQLPGPMPELDPLAQAAQDAVAAPAPNDIPSRLPGGVSLSLAVLLGLAVGSRRHAAGALVSGLAVAAVGGWWAMVGTSLVATGPLAGTVGAVLPGVLGATGWSAWLAGPLLLAARGLLGVPWRAVPIVLLVFEGITESAQLTPLSPQPATMALLGIPAGNVVVVPSPAPPYHQGDRPVAELLFRAGRHQHPVPLGLEADPGELPLVVELSRVMDEPIDLGVAEQAWTHREQDPFQAAADAGFTAILIDQRDLDQATRQALDGTIARQVGTAFSNQGEWAVYGLVKLDGGGQ